MYRKNGVGGTQTKGVPKFHDTGNSATALLHAGDNQPQYTS